MKARGTKYICQNRKARHEYHIEDTIEAGLVLLGPEVKSLRDGRANLTDSYASFEGGELWLLNCHISPYPHAAHWDRLDPMRPRKLLLHARELRKLVGKVQERGYALIPLSLYFREGKVKAELALAKGKKLHDKRESAKERTIERELRKEYRIR